MRLPAQLAMICGIEDEDVDFFSVQFREKHDRLWWRQGEFTTLVEAQNEMSRYLDCMKDRDVETRIVEAHYKLL